MIDDPIERLSSFHPSAEGLDRDALLFAAGKASGPSDLGARALAALLMLTQTMTLLGWLWWPLSSKEAQRASPTETPVPVNAYEKPPTEVALREGSLLPLLGSVAEVPMENLVPDESPLLPLDFSAFLDKRSEK